MGTESYDTGRTGRELTCFYQRHIRGAGVSASDAGPVTDNDGIGCEEFVELVTGYLEGAMDEPTRRRFEEHLALCEGCEIYLDQTRETARLLDRIPAGMICSTRSPAGRVPRLEAVF